MQYRLMDLLCCPACKRGLNIEVFKYARIPRTAQFSTRRCRERCAFVEQGLATAADCQACGEMEVLEALIRCDCGKAYPVIGGVPRFLPPELEPELVKRYPKFFDSYGEQFQKPASDIDRTKVTELKAQTMNSFGYEWTEFRDYDAKNFLELIAPIKQDYFAAKLGLDCGCGAGRHTKDVVSYGAEMVAMDISWAVEAAHYKNLPTASAMVVQADVFNLPFKKNRFDFVFSLGVLHHTTNPPRSFDSLVAMLNMGGAIMVWIYSSQRKYLLQALRLVRVVTLRMPNWLLKRVSFLAACIDYGGVVFPFKLLSRIPGLSWLLEKITPPRVRGYAKYDFRVSYTDWFDRLSYPCVNYYSGDEVRAWYERNNLGEISVSATGPFAWRGYGIKM